MHGARAAWARRTVPARLRRSSRPRWHGEGDYGVTNHAPVSDARFCPMTTAVKVRSRRAIGAVRGAGRAPASAVEEYARRVEVMRGSEGGGAEGDVRGGHVDAEGAYGFEYV